jgi:hypothetical protein
VDSRNLSAVALVALLAWVVFRRLRRTFGAQRLEATRLYVRAAILSLLGVVMLAVSARHLGLLGALGAGLAGGAALGLLGLRHTQFETTPQGRFYTPHTYIGLAVSALFLGRLAWRFLTTGVAASGFAAQAAVPAGQDPLAGAQQSPVTLAIFGLLVGYYVIFNVGVASSSRYPAIPAATPAPPP